MVETKRYTKVLMTTDTIGGVWTYCMDLCSALQPYGVQVHLLTMGGEMNPHQREKVEALGNVVVYETAYRLEWMHAPWQDIQECGDYLLQLERELEPDLVHLNCYAYGSLPFTAPVLIVAHSDVWSWFLAVKGEEPSSEWKEYFRCVKKGLHGADKIVAPSGAMLRAIQKIYDIEDGEVIYNGRASELFSIGEKQPFVFSTGRLWDEGKNVKLLAEAAPLINAPVRIAGDNRFEQSSFYSIANNVEYLGRCSAKEIAEQLSATAIYALPAKYEPFGLSVLEAALSGCTLVLGDIPSLREIWRDAAIYVDTNKPDDLIQTINRIISNEALRQTWSEKAVRRAQHFTLQKTAQEYWQCYQMLLQKNIRLQKQLTT